MRRRSSNVAWIKCARLTRTPLSVEEVEAVHKEK